MFFFFVSEAIKIAVSVSVFLLYCSCEITQNMVFQLLIDFKVEKQF